MDRTAGDVIVAVDDDEGLHKMMRYLLRVPNTTLVPALSGEQALEILREGLPDLLLLDAVLQDTTGFDLCRRLRREHPPERLPILMITALQDADSVDAAFEAGADDFITKPINWAVLRQRVMRLLAAKRSRSELATTERVMERLIEHAPDALLSLDPAGVILTANRAARRLLLAPGSQEALAGRRLVELLQSGDGAAPVAEGEAVVRRADGSLLSLEVSAGKVSVDRSTRWVVILRDVTGRKRGEDELRHRAMYDPLTELPNRALFLERLEQALSQARRGEDSRFSVVFIDLDDFKRVNDECGHQAGDAYLTEAARRIREALRPGDTVGRYGGDEFCAILSGVAEALAEPVIERIRTALGEPLTLEGKTYHPRASIGLAAADGAHSARELLERADLAMYEAKRAGKGRCRVWGAG